VDNISPMELTRSLRTQESGLQNTCSPIIAEALVFSSLRGTVGWRYMGIFEDRLLDYAGSEFGGRCTLSSQR